MRQAAVGASLVEGDVALCGVGEGLGLRGVSSVKVKGVQGVVSDILYLCDRISYVG